MIVVSIMGRFRKKRVSGYGLIIFYNGGIRSKLYVTGRMEEKKNHQASSQSCGKETAQGAAIFIIKQATSTVHYSPVFPHESQLSKVYHRDTRDLNNQSLPD